MSEICDYRKFVVKPGSGLRCSRELILSFNFFSSDGAVVYRLDPEQGPLRVLSERDGEDRNRLVTGSALLALAADEMPASGELAGLRLALRGVLSHHLGPQGLRSWQLLGDLARVGQG